MRAGRLSLQCYTCPMRIILTYSLLLTAALAQFGQAAPPVELEIATERGVQITAPHEWLQLLTELGITNVRVRGKQAGDEIKATNRGTADSPQYHLLGVLTSGNRLLLPGGSFTRGDRTALKDYFVRLADDGTESLTARRGRFGLTLKELETITTELAQPIDFETTGQQPHRVIERLQSHIGTRLNLDPADDQSLRAAKPLADELRGLTIGTALAMMLRHDGLVLRPEKTRGQPLTLRVLHRKAEPLAESTLGRTDDDEIVNWPIGWEPQQTPGRTAPALFEPRNAEIDGYSLAETLAAIGPRLKTPLYLDHAALAEGRIDPAAIQVRLARTRANYKRILDRVLAQAHLHSDLRVDEAGTPFLWVTR